jgi:hypothetical protein
MLQPGSCLPEPLDQLTANTLTNITQRIADAPTQAGQGLRLEFQGFLFQGFLFQGFLFQGFKVSRFQVSS